MSFLTEKKKQFEKFENEKIHSKIKKKFDEVSEQKKCKMNQKNVKFKFEKEKNEMQIEK